jgi:hypothetical protein
LITVPYLERCFTVRYEEFVAVTEDSFREIFRFLHVPFEQAPVDALRSTRFNSSFPVHSTVPASDPWPTWTREQQRAFLEEAGETMVRYDLLSQVALRELWEDAGVGPRRALSARE